jgi:hypothetical protein
VEFVWPLLVICAGLVAPLVGAYEFVKAHDRFKREHPVEYPQASGMEAAREEPRMFLLPIATLFVSPALMVVGLAWLIWALVT